MKRLVGLFPLLTVSLFAQRGPRLDPAELARIADAKAMPNRCGPNVQMLDPTQNPSWNGWGAGYSNARFQDADDAGISAAQVPKLKLKWAFGFPAARSVYGQPTVVGGRVFLGVDTGFVYAIDAATGCAAWSYQAEAGVRSAVVVEEVSRGRYAAFFGDLKANVYAVNPFDGTLFWKVHVDEHPSARITAAPQYFEGRLFVPVASGEEGAGVNPKYECCTFRGSVVALDAASGKQIWKTYTIADKPKPAGKNSNGVARFASAGGAVWNSPTIDPRRGALYIGTGDAYTEPAPKTTDSVMALDLATGAVMWSVQDTSNDAWLVGCTGANHPENCPKDLGPDQDFGASPMLKMLPDGRSLLIAPQKSGIVWAHDPDHKGAVVWKTALVANTTEFGAKMVWGGAADDSTGYFGLAAGGIAALGLKDGERKWFTPLQPAPEVAKHPGQDGALTAIPGIVFSAGWDGVLRALSSSDGHVVWQYNTSHDFETVNGGQAKGGSMGAPGPTVAGGMLFVGSGYVGVKQGMPGNVLLAFGVQ